MSTDCQTRLYLALATVLSATTAQCEPETDFLQQVVPIFEQHCIACHGSDEPESGLQLTSRKAALAGGYSGKVILPGNSRQSLLVKMVSGTHDDGL